MRRRLCVPIVTACLLLSGIGKAPAQTCDCDIPLATVARYDALLRLGPYTQEGTVAAHLPWGVPLSPPAHIDELLLVQQHYVIR